MVSTFNIKQLLVVIFIVSIISGWVVIQALIWLVVKLLVWSFTIIFVISITLLLVVTQLSAWLFNLIKGIKKGLKNAR
jgi:hypothetical protein